MSTDDGLGLWLKPSEALNRFALPEGWGEEPNTATEEWQAHRYGFVVGNVGLLLGSQTHSEVPERADIYPLPGVPAWFRGLTNLRGNLVPVFDVVQLLEGHHEQTDDERVLILDQGEKSAGILIQGYPRALERLRSLPERPPLPPVLEGFAPEAFGDGERIWLEFDHQGFFHSLAERFES